MTTNAWEACQLGKAAEVVRGVSFAKPDATPLPGPGKIPILRAGNIQDELLLDEDLIWVDRAKVSEKQFVRCDDLVVCMSSGSAAIVGKCARATSGWNGSFGAFCAVVRPNQEICDPAFLFYAMRSPQFRAWTAKSSGANIKNIRKTELEQYNILLPPLPEQRRIATILGGADAIRRKRQQAIALTEELLRSAFLEMFGDPAANPKGWGQRPIAELATVSTGNTPPRAQPDLYGDNLEWIKSDNINTTQHVLTTAAERLSAKGRSMARVADPGATLITCIAGSPSCIGNAAMTDRQVAFNQQINALEPKAGVTPAFLYTQVLLGKQLIQRASTKSMKGMVSKSRLEAVKFMDPPGELQVRFSRWFEGWRSLQTSLLTAQALDEFLFGALSQSAFRGAL